MQMSGGLMHPALSLKPPVSKLIAAAPRIGMHPHMIQHDCTVSALPWRKHQQEPEKSGTRRLRKLTAQEIAAIRKAQREWQERVDALGMQPVFEAYEDYNVFRIAFTLKAVRFFIVLAVLWFIAAQSEQPVDTRERSEVIATLIVRTSLVMWSGYTAYLAAGDFAVRHGTLKRRFEQICWTLRNVHTGQELAAAFRELKGTKLDLSKLW